MSNSDNSSNKKSRSLNSSINNSTESYNKTSEKESIDILLPSKSSLNNTENLENQSRSSNEDNDSEFEKNESLHEKSISESEIRIDSSFSIIHQETFNNLKHPLDVLEQIYSSPMCISDFYGVNDLKSPKPYSNPFSSDENEILIESSVIKLVKICIKISIIKLVVCPYLILFEFFNIGVLRELKPKLVFCYSIFLIFMIFTRIFILVYMIIFLSSFGLVAAFTGIFAVGLFVEIFQIYKNLELFMKTKDLDEECLEIISYEATKKF